LVLGISSGVILVQRQQDIREKAAPSLVHEPPACVADGKCYGPGEDCCSGKTYTDNSCLSTQERCGTKTAPPPGPVTCNLTGAELCVGNNPVGDCYQGGDGNSYACYSLQGNPGKKISGSTNCDCPAPYTWGPRQEYGSWWCFNTAITNCSPNIVDGLDTSERCSLLPEQCAPTSTPPPPPPQPTPSPPPPGISAQCLNIQAFDTDWNKLSSADLSNLKPGDTVRFTVAGTTTSGTIDKARFTINGVQRLEVTQKRPGTQEFYDEYTLPEGITSFSINAQLHHSDPSIGWF